MTETGPLPRVQVWEQMDQLSEWQLDEHSLHASYQLRSTATALQFIAKVGLSAEQLNYHPEILWRYEQVDISIKIRSVHGVCEKDFTLAARISSIAAAFDALPVELG